MSSDLTNRTISFKYTPRPIQAFLHMTKRQKMIRFFVAVCHRRFGKTKWLLGEIATSGFECPHHNPQYAYIAPTYGQAERVAWTYLKEMFEEYPGVEKNEAKLRIKIPRHDKGDFITIFLLGGENYDSIRGIYLDGCGLDEYAQMNPAIWGEVVRPALSDRKGWAIFIGTPKGMNQFYEMYDTARRNMGNHPELKWFAFNAPASKTGIIDADELKAMRHEMSEEEYEQELECSFQAALVGSYYGKIMSELDKEGKIGSFPHDPRMGVSTYWDIGVDDSTAIWFIQRINGGYRIIDYLEMSGMGLDYFVNELKKKPYTYDMHWFPHDVKVREWTSGVSRIEQARTLLGSNVRVAKKVSVADGINAVRIILRSSEFNLLNCSRGIKALTNYERRWDAKNGIFQDHPLHNWASHASDAFRVFAVCANIGNSVDLKKLPREAESKYNPWR